MASKKTIVECFDVLDMAYPQTYRHLGADQRKTLLKLWEDDFRDFDDRTLKKLVVEIRRECRYFPTVAELLDLGYRVKGPGSRYRDLEEDS